MLINAEPVSIRLASPHGLAPGRFHKVWELARLLQLTASTFWITLAVHGVDIPPHQKTIWQYH